MAVRQMLGRLLLVLMFLASGVDKVSNPAPGQALLNARYEATEKFVGRLGVPLPLSAEVVKELSQVIIQIMGVLMLVGAMLTLFNLRYGPGLLTAQMILITVVIHNPMLATSSQETQNELIQALKNLAVIGGLLQVCCQQCVSTPKQEHVQVGEKPKKKTD